MNSLNREINPDELEYLISEFPHITPDVIRNYLELYNFEDTLYTLQTFYPASNESISQEDKDEMISILHQINDLDIDVCSILLEDSNYDLEKAKEKTNEMCKLLEQHKSTQINEKYLMLKEEFPNEDEIVIQNAINFAEGDYSLAKSFIIDQISSSQQPKIQAKAKGKKIAIIENDQVTFDCQKNKKKPKKEKKKSQFIQFDRKRNENKNDEYQNHDKNFDENGKDNDNDNSEIKSTQQLSKQEFDDNNNYNDFESVKNLVHKELDNDNDNSEIKSTQQLSKQEFDNNNNYNDDKSIKDSVHKELDNDNNHSEIKSTQKLSKSEFDDSNYCDDAESVKVPVHKKLDNDDDDDEDEYLKEKRRLKRQSHSTNKSTKMPQRYFRPPDLVVRDIDLHGVREVDAEEIVIRSLNDAQNSNVSSIYFITGSGHHSQNNRSILRPLVFKICKRMGYKPCLSADKGCVICKIK